MIRRKSRAPHRTNTSFWWRSMRVAVGMKGTRKMGCGTGEGSSTTRMEATTMGNGRTIRCMDGVNSTTREASSPTRVTGQMTSSTGTEKSTMTALSSSPKTPGSTTQTLTCLMTTGSIMRACCQEIPKKAGEKYNSPTGRSSKVTSTTTVSRASASSPRSTVS